MGWTGSLFDGVPERSGPDLDVIVQGLNAAQREAVCHGEGPVLVLAGAGSGKTRVLTARIARLIGAHGVSPHEILAVTFTNKAAGEMRSRIAALLGHEPGGMWCGTFHSLGARLLRGVAPMVGRQRNFTIYDEDDALNAVKRIMERRTLNTAQFTPRAILGAISSAKNALMSPAEYGRRARDTFAVAVAGVYGELDVGLQQANAVTFDDLLLLPVRVLEMDETLRTHYQHRFRFVLVDEFQDTNAAQYRFVKLMGGAKRNVMAVGDDDQSIYGWRGADIRNILEFERDFPGARIVRLEENYRSTPNVLALANAVIAENSERRGKTLRTTRPVGEPVTVVEALDDRDEADYIAGTIMERVDESRLALRNFAVLYRTNAQSRVLEDAFRRRNIPYRLIGAVRFYDRREIRDLMAYLRLIANPADDEAFRRAMNVPRRGLGEGTMTLLAARAATESSSLFDIARRADAMANIRPSARRALGHFVDVIVRLRTRAMDAAVDELLHELLVAIDYEQHLAAEGAEGLERLDNVRELISGAAEMVADEGGEVGLTPLDHFLQSSSLVAGVDRLDPDADAVVCMTMHNAKGLEFPVVFVCGLEDGLFPLSRASDEATQLEEERRLFYVGITRAQEKLYLTCAEQRWRNGELMQSVSSRFLDVVTASLAEREWTPRARAEGRGTLGATARGYADYSGTRSHRFGDADRGRGSHDDGCERPRDRIGRSAGHYASAGYRLRSRTSRRNAAGRGNGTFVGSDSCFRQGRPPAAEDESQDVPLFMPGERVMHARFGTGTIAELIGIGREAKVRIDFDDEEIGRKTLVIAQAKLERGLD